MNKSKISFFTVLVVFFLFPLSLLSQISTDICEGDSIVLRATVPYETIGWYDKDGYLLKNDASVADTAPKVSPTSNTFYTAKILNTKKNNLIPWGCFESIPMGGWEYISNMLYIPDATIRFTEDWINGYFSIIDNPQILFDEEEFSSHPDINISTNWYDSIGDHTSGKGNMLVANGGTIENAIFRTRIKVVAETNYIISAWFANIHRKHKYPYQISIIIDGVKVGDMYGLENNTWQRHYSGWKATSTKEIEIVFQNNQTNGLGNDFAIDDISFTPIIKEFYKINIKDCTVSIENNKTDELTIYPNPTNCNISIGGLDNSNTSITIYNSQGVVVLEVNDLSSNNNLINVGNLSSGIYIATISNSDLTKTIRFVKE